MSESQRSRGTRRIRKGGATKLGNCERSEKMELEAERLMSGKKSGRAVAGNICS